MKRALIFVHRWLGVALCLVFLLWFPSGYRHHVLGLPGRRAGRRASPDAAPIDVAKIRLSPAEAYARLGAGGEVEDVLLDTFDGRPAYRFGAAFGEEIVYADTGEEQLEVSDAMVRRIADRGRSSQPSSARSSRSPRSISGPFRCASRI